MIRLLNIKRPVNANLISLKIRHAAVSFQSFFFLFSWTVTQPSPLEGALRDFPDAELCFFHFSRDNLTIVTPFDIKVSFHDTVV